MAPNKLQSNFSTQRLLMVPRGIVSPTCTHARIHLHVLLHGYIYTYDVRSLNLLRTNDSLRRRHETSLAAALTRDPQHHTCTHDGCVSRDNDPCWGTAVERFDFFPSLQRRSHTWVGMQKIKYKNNTKTHSHP